ncbi:MAG: hypothetical protein SCH71_06560 [Desulfobulbaceae bacterium]|nr:hypothetical protein [Desulfobulbaceae bacterium]
METLFAGVDVSALSSNIALLLLTFITIGLMFIARRYIAHVLRERTADFDLDYDRDQFQRWDATTPKWGYNNQGEQFYDHGWFGGKHGDGSTIFSDGNTKDDSNY